MRSVFLLALASIGIVIGSPLLADTINPMQAMDSNSLRTPAGYTAGIQFQSYRYKEPTVGFKNKGYLYYGVHLGWTHLCDASDCFFTAQTSYSQGKMDYSSSTTGSLNDLPITEFELRGLLGRDFDLGYGTFAPYAGLGYRYFFKDERGTTTTSDLGYRSSNSLGYIPLGANYRFQVYGYTTIANAEVDVVFMGIQRTYLQDAGFVEIRNYQASGLGYRASLAVELGNFTFGPFFKHWHVTASDDTVVADYEFQKAKNSTSNIGFDLTYRF